MTVTQKIRAKNSKSGFTLVELVIVIAILAILAAIAIPVITTTINSARISVFESDAATLNMLVKEAINVSKAELPTTYNSKSVKVATINDICVENSIGQDGNFLISDKTFFRRTIGNTVYDIVFTKSKDIKLTGGVFSDTIPATDIEFYLYNGDKPISDLEP